VDVFDIFLPTGKEKLKADDGLPSGDLPQGEKSVAFHITYRSDEHTLTDSEVSRIEEAIKKALQEKLDAQIR
jgi:phenylalanyl-tRNA synthetase beta subunit